MLASSLVIFILTLALSVSFDLPKIPCHSDFNITGERYNLSIAYDIGDSYPQDANFDANGNLFFIKCFDNFTKSEVCVLENSSNEIFTIKGVPDNDTYSIAIDKSDNIVYIGTTNGIYKYNRQNKTADIFLDGELNILNLRKDDSKIVAENIKEIQDTFVVNGDKKIQFDSLEVFDDIAVDDHNNYYYIRDGQVFLLKASSVTPICIGNITMDSSAQITLYRDYVFIAGNKLMYYRDNKTNGLQEISNVPGRITTIAFDYINTMVMGVKGKLYKYKKINCIFRERIKYLF